MMSSPKHDKYKLASVGKHVLYFCDQSHSLLITPFLGDFFLLMLMLPEVLLLHEQLGTMKPLRLLQ